MGTFNLEISANLARVCTRAAQTCVILAGQRCSQNHERKQRLIHTAVGIVPRRVKAQAALSYDVFFGHTTPWSCLVTGPMPL